VRSVPTVTAAHSGREAAFLLHGVLYLQRVPHPGLLHLTIVSDIFYWKRYLIHS